MDNLKIIRVKLQLSQAEFGDGLKMTQTEIARYENGKIEPKIGFIYKLMEIYNINPTYLFTGAGDMFLDKSLVPKCSLSASVDEGEDTKVDIILDRLFIYFNVNSSIELSKKINVSQQAISSWRSRNSVSAVKRKCIQLGVYSDIFEVEIEKKIALSQEVDRLLNISKLVMNKDPEKEKSFEDNLKLWIASNI